jgi:hypothetical protein
LTTLISPPGEAFAVTNAAGLNFQPLGAISIKVTFVPTEKSVIAPSVRIIFPNVVKDGELEFSALSAEIKVPPVALVIVTTAFALLKNSRQKIIKDIILQGSFVKVKAFRY